MAKYIPPSQRSKYSYSPHSKIDSQIGIEDVNSTALQSAHSNPKTNTKSHSDVVNNDEDSLSHHYLKSQNSHLRRFKGNTLARLNYKIKQNIIYNKYLNHTLATSSTQHPNGKTLHNEDASFLPHPTPQPSNAKLRTTTYNSATTPHKSNDTQYIIGKKLNANGNGSELFPQNRTYQIPHNRKCAKFETENKYGTVSPSKAVTNNINGINNEAVHSTIQSNAIFKEISDNKTHGTILSHKKITKLIEKFGEKLGGEKISSKKLTKTITNDINDSNNETAHNTLPSNTIFKAIVDGETRGTYKKGANLIKKYSEALSGQKMLSSQIYSSKRCSKNGNEASPCSDMTPQKSCSGLSASKSILNADKLSLGDNGNTDENINGNTLVLPTLQLYSIELINLITNQSLINIYLMYALISGVILTILDTG